MKILWFWMVMIGVSLPAAAQQAPGVGAVQPPATGEAANWDVVADSGGTTGVRAVGAAVRITATSAAVVTRSAWLARGQFQVRATVHRAAGAAPTAAYGLVLGDRGSGEHVAFLVRPDGSVAIAQTQASAVTLLRPWTPTLALRAPAPDGSALDVLEVRVAATTATFLINGEEAATLAITPGHLDGTPGVHVAAGGDVTVAALAVSGDSVGGAPGATVVR